ncbi:hypothetical protein [Sphaerisporangium fuscum]|uniref:hypothetical protein n=1 Tax=Sphaerisporangium fuscum TaxID=2835868 RepID=UPI001BDDA99C|nr:hypothetical protein [Sphaerisporangium fuscum]
MQAEATAAEGDRYQALSLFQHAEQDLERADSLLETEWTGNYRRESLEHQTGLMLAALGDLAGAEEHFALSVGARRSVERRTRILIGARLAHVQIHRRQPQASAKTVLRLGADLSGITRVTSELRALRAAWAPYRKEREVQDADRLLAGLLS